MDGFLTNCDNLPNGGNLPEKNLLYLVPSICYKTIVLYYSKILGFGIKLINPNDPSAMPIGVGSGSQAFLPQFIKANGLVFYDLPGFLDTRGPAENLVNACFIKRIIENAKSAKLVFVVGLDEITAQRGDIVIRLSEKVKQLIPNKPIENFSSLIITKSYLPKAALSSFITTNLTPDITQNPNLSLLNFWINNGKMDMMSRPMTPLMDINQRVDILNLIGVMGSDNLAPIDIGVIYDITQQLAIKAIYDAEIQDIIEKLLLQNFQVQNSQVQGLSVLDKRTLEDKKTYMIDGINGFKPSVCSELDGSSLIKLLRPISENQYQESWHAKERALATRISLIVAQIDVEIREKQRQEAEAEAARQAEVARQAQADARTAREAADRAAEETRKLKAELDRQREREEEKRTHIQTYGYCQNSYDGKHEIQYVYYKSTTYHLSYYACRNCRYFSEEDRALFGEDYSKKLTTYDAARFDATELHYPGSLGFEHYRLLDDKWRR